MRSPLIRWLQVCMLNLLLVAFAGVLLRYKIAFFFPFINQKFLLHGHSHFAFAGWLTQVLMILLVQHLVQYKTEIVWKKYRWLLYGNCITAYGMLVFFPVQGYAAMSIAFSTLSIINSYFFAVLYWKDLNRISSGNAADPWFKASLFFNVVSSLGAFGLAFMMANKISHQNWYLAAVYYFLHFQYNGWFFFAVMGLLISRLNITGSRKQWRIIFLLFSIACIPAYFLSVIWMNIPAMLYLVVVAAAIAQFIAWILTVKLILHNKTSILHAFPGKGMPLMIIPALALTVKLLLQLGSAYPPLGQLSAGFRPIVIGYLHLVLLGVISVFILGYILSMNLIPNPNGFVRGARVFITGIILNELILMVQGITGLYYIVVPYIDKALFAAALIMFTGAGILFGAMRSANRKSALADRPAFS
jgi:hypothetical protein